jgi:hypothetical protein
MDQETKWQNMNSNLEENQDLQTKKCMKHQTWVQFWNLEVCEQNNNLQDIRCLQ